MSSEFELTVTVPAQEWAHCQRRLVFLKNLVIHLSRDGMQTREWFSAAEIAAMALPGLPDNRSALSRRAGAAGWLRRRDGRQVLYHVASLPSRAFDALMMRILDLPELDIEAAGLQPPDPPAEGEGAPPWVLPLMRLMRGPAKGDLGRAWRDLPDHLPNGTVLPTPDEAATILVELGLSEKVANWSEH